MQIEDACNLARLSHIESALEADRQFGFPQDTTGLLRLFLQTLSFLSAEFGSKDTPADLPSALKAALIERLEIAADLEKRSLAQLEEGTPAVDGVGHSFDHPSVH